MFSPADAPKLPSVSVTPSGEIMEESSVTLSCSSDANPAANYTWYKENQRLLQGPGGSYHFTSISSEDRRIYCKSENEYGWISSSLLLNVHCELHKSVQSFMIQKSFKVMHANINGMCLYIYCPPDAPKLPSVSVSPSAEIVEGSSVTLTCSSDANPAANYTWYKENRDTPKASGRTFTITDIRPEHSGNYYCEAQNRRGRHNSTLELTVVASKFPSTYIWVGFCDPPCTLHICQLRSCFFSPCVMVEAHGCPQKSSNLLQST